MSEFIQANTGIVTKQILGSETVELVGARGFMLMDVLISSTSNGQVTLLVRDEEHVHIIVSIVGKQTFSHAFVGGWMFWDHARLEVVKESNNGEVNIAVGVVKTTVAKNYNQWRRKI